MTRTIKSLAPLLAFSLIILGVPACDGQEYTLDSKSQLAAELGSEGPDGVDPHAAFSACFDELEACINTDDGRDACFEAFRSCLPTPPPGARAEGERPEGQRPEGQRPEGDRPEGQRPQGDRPPHMRPPRGDRPEGPRGDLPEGDDARPQHPGEHPRPPALHLCIETLDACLDENDVDSCFAEARVCIDETIAAHREEMCTEGLERCEALGEDAPPHCAQVTERCVSEVD